MDNIFNEEPTNEEPQNDLLEKMEQLHKEIMQSVMTCDFKDTPKSIKSILSKYFKNTEEIYSKCIEIGTREQEYNYSHKYCKINFNALFKELEKEKTEAKIFK